MPTSSSTLSHRFSLTLPQSGTDTPQEIICGQSVVLVGANGSGKTRLGSWIEFSSGRLESVHRIAAQKSLTMPESSSTSSIEEAEASLYYQAPPENAKQHPSLFRNGNRWQNKPSTSLLNDFKALMVLLFTEDYEKSGSYRQLQKQSNTLIDIPETRLDVVKQIWEAVLPHRTLSNASSKIEVQDSRTQSPKYNGSEMSDGERVIFYLIGQSLCAPQGGIIIIDEPELHIHKSIQIKLWTAIQAARPDCLFIYMTHDVEFAASLTEAKKIWIKSYNGQVWEWEEVPESDLPEELLLEVLGIRQPILFVEGENGSYDTALCRALYPKFRVIPRGSCSSVIESTRELRKLPSLHRIKAYGLIDRDRRLDEEVEALELDGVKVLDVAEIENLFCVPEVLEIVARRQMKDEQAIEASRRFIMRELNKELGNQIALHVSNEIAYRLNGFATRHHEADQVQSELVAHLGRVDVPALVLQTKEKFQKALDENDYKTVLKLYNRKTLAGRISGNFGLADKELPSLVVNLIQRGEGAELVEALRSYIPNFSDM